MCDVGVSGVCLLVNKEYCRTGVHWQRTTVQIEFFQLDDRSATGFLFISGPHAFRVNSTLLCYHFK